MNLFDMNSDVITMNIDGKDIEMKPAMCHGKEYDRWLVSKCGKVWSKKRNKLIKGHRSHYHKKNSKRLHCIKYNMKVNEADWWGDGSGILDRAGCWTRTISAHKMIMDTWKPLYDNPPEGIVWEEWKIVRDLPSVYDHINKAGSIDHIDDNPANNHIDNLRRVTSWDNNHARKAKGI